jgi:hypothetical protein
MKTIKTKRVSVKNPKKTQPQNRRVLGSAAGTIRFRKGSDTPLTDRELTKLIGR